MLRTPLCDALGIEVPVIQGSFGPYPTVELSAAVSEAGGLGSLGTALKPLDVQRAEWARMRELTDRPFAVNHTFRPFSEESFAATLAFGPAVVSMALGDPGDLVGRAHDAGCRFVQQVHTVSQAVRAAELGVDVIIAQGGEAGGFGGTVSTMALVPQVVDAVSPVPVAAAGGVADGRGLAAALVLGAAGVNIGTRFLASVEAAVSDDWKQAILRAESEDAVKVEFSDLVLPIPEGGFAVRPRSLRTPFVDRWNARLDEVPAEAERLRAELVDSIRSGTSHELVAFTGQTAGLVHDVLPAAEIVRRLVAEAEAALAGAGGLFGRSGHLAQGGQHRAAQVVGPHA